MDTPVTRSGRYSGEVPEEDVRARYALIECHSRGCLRHSGKHNDALSRGIGIGSAALMATPASLTPYQKVWGGGGEPALPIYAVTLAGVLQGAVLSSRSYLFRQAVAR